MTNLVLAREKMYNMAAVIAGKPEPLNTEIGEDTMVGFRHYIKIRLYLMLYAHEPETKNQDVNQ